MDWKIYINRKNNWGQLILFYRKSSHFEISSKFMISSTTIDREKVFVAKKQDFWTLEK